MTTLPHYKDGRERSRAKNDAAFALFIPFTEFILYLLSKGYDMVRDISTSYAAINKKRLLFTAVALLGYLQPSIAQRAADKFWHLSFGGCTESNKTTTWARVLAHPALEITSPTLPVYGYTIGFKPGDGDYRGPYINLGAELNTQIKSAIRDHLIKDPYCTIYIESIIVLESGIERTLASPFLFTVSDQ